MSNTDSTYNGQLAAERDAYHQACRTVCEFCGGRGLHYVECKDLRRAAYERAQPLLFPVAKLYANVWCSQCGEDFGPGAHGFSSCDQHAIAECEACHA